MKSHYIQPDILITLDEICRYCIQYDKENSQADKIRHDIAEKIYIQKPYNREL